jgi:hypothetical protein
MKTLQSLGYISGIIFMCTALNAAVPQVSKLPKDQAVAFCKNECEKDVHETKETSIACATTASCADDCTRNHGETYKDRCHEIAKKA